MKRAFLAELGITDSDVVKKIIDYHQGVVQDLKEDISKVKSELETAKSNTGNGEFKSKYEELKAKYDSELPKLQKEYDDYKAGVDAEKTISTKKTALRSQLESDGANPKLVDLLELKFDLNSIELGDDNKISGWEDLSKGIKETYSDVFGNAKVSGVDTANPPANNQSEEDAFLAGFKDY